MSAEELAAGYTQPDTDEFAQSVASREAASSFGIEYSQTQDSDDEGPGLPAKEPPQKRKREEHRAKP